ncbi:Stk1 family PASTA domain-containing Ser/Thr kinase [Pseudonocardia sp. DSM 110487]|uniref:Stk1 family PASTA domain-containing Ser/Thr kinase n=1 Tax=Pseudonocardia sp. DSM 110487 TaxID=2865833 RepID=UPI001C696F54|nr:Stk1 family PASTA domain-containing Ser/Thr kinase [Pseudonocardia sp. DSM 110487]QYN35830.1 Stk1 family PASTA domain-containing Ser/Thr kinase [Pseudonocardia sp. DSM 110487]
MTTPRLLSERYELGEVLGYGGMSEVHKGLDTRLGRDVAVKVLRADLARDPQFQMRFRREAQNAASLNHPAIVSVYDTGEVQGEFGPLPYIVMEFVDGQTLREIVKTQGPMTQRQVIEVMADVCAALDFSHRHNIIHRDVKPANIMINHAGAVKVMDFGIARALGEGQNVTQTAAVIGTAQYLSPEQARGEAVDARSDVYAAGCVLFELLTGEPPFTGDTPVAVAYQHVREEPRRPSELNPSIPSSLDAVVLKALSKNPLNRYQSSAEMRSDLVRVRNGQAPMAPLVMSDDERTAMIASSPAAPTRRINGRHAPAPSDNYDDYYDEPPRRSTAKVIGVAVVVVLALSVVGFFAYQVLSGPPAPQTVSVPVVTNMTETEARNQLIAAGLRPGDPQPQESTVEQKGRVISTDPQVGTPVDERSSVTLIVGSGPATVTVPRLEGMTPQQAEAALQAEGLELGQQRPQETADPSQVNKVINSNPRAGDSAKGGAQVDIIVGAQQTGVRVPDVSGQDVDDAVNALEDAGLRPQRPDGADDTDKVSGTNPPANQTVPPGTEVDLLTGSSDEVTMPDLTGLREEQAKDRLAGLGFSRVSIRRQQSNESQDGRVLDQSVEPDSQVSTDQTVTLTIGDAPGGLVN